MSDNIYNNKISGRNSHTSYENYLCHLNKTFGENGNCAQEKVFGENEEERNVQQRKMFGQNCPQSEEGVYMENIDDAYEGELGRLSSRLIQLLSNTRQRCLQMKANCGMSQRPHLVRSSNPQGDTNPFLDVHRERQFILHPNSSVETDIAEYTGSVAEPEIIMPAVFGNTGTTFPNNAALPDLAFRGTDEKAGTNQIPGVSKRRTSAQTLVTPLSDIPDQRDRQRKYARNKHEKKRRSAMADSIAELGNLLPDDNNSASCWQKSTILKKSVDYIKRLKDQNAIQQLEDKMREINMEIKTVTRRLERVEYSTYINSPDQNQIETASMEPHISRCMAKAPVTCLKTSSFHSYSPLNESTSNVLKAPSLSTSMSLDDVWDGYSSTLSADELMSLPSSFEKGTDDMDCYI